MEITRLSYFKYLNYVENLKFVSLLYHMAVTASFYGLKILGIQLFYPGEDNVSILKATIKRQIIKTNTIPPIRNGIHHFLRFSIFIFTPIMAEIPNIAINNISIILFSDYLDTLFQKFSVVITTLQHTHLMDGDLVEFDKPL